VRNNLAVFCVFCAALLRKSVHHLIGAKWGGGVFIGGAHDGRSNGVLWSRDGFLCGRHSEQPWGLRRWSNVSDGRHVGHPADVGTRVVTAVGAAMGTFFVGEDEKKILLVFFSD
jgi:hypothetical protein